MWARSSSGCWFSVLMIKQWEMDLKGFEKLEAGMPNCSVQVHYHYLQSNPIDPTRYFHRNFGLSLNVWSVRLY